MGVSGSFCNQQIKKISICSVYDKKKACSNPDKKLFKSQNSIMLRIYFFLSFKYWNPFSPISVQRVW